MYCTTFPCHNCAKHIIAAGISRAIYMEPYPKSKAAEFHDDAITLGFSTQKNKIQFEPFIGVGPRRFFDLFSLKLSSGTKLKRKDKDHQTIEWKPEDANLRLQMLPCSYIDLELSASDLFNGVRKREKKNEQDLFREHLERSSEIVASWPEWKRTILGYYGIADEDDKSVESEIHEYHDRIEKT